MTGIAKALGDILAQFSKFFDILDLSYFISGAVCFAAIRFWLDAANVPTSSPLNGFGSIVATAVGCYILGLICFSLGRFVRQSFTTVMVRFSLFNIAAKFSTFFSNRYKFSTFFVNDLEAHGLEDTLFRPSETAAISKLVEHFRTYLMKPHDQQTNAVSNYLLSKLSATSKAKIESARPITTQLVTEVRKALNEQIARDDFSLLDEFKSTDCPNAKELSDTRSDAQRMLRNRMLLSCAFPQELNETSRGAADGNVVADYLDRATLKPHRADAIRRALYTRLWTEARQSPLLAPSFAVLNRYWVLSASYDGLATALCFWAFVLVVIPRADTGSARFTVDDVVNPVELATRLKSRPDRLYTYLYEHLPHSSGPSFIDNYKPPGTLTLEQQGALVYALNDALFDPKLYSGDKVRFSENAGSDAETYEKGKFLSPDDIRFHRRLLESALPTFLRQRWMPNNRALPGAIFGLILLAIACLHEGGKLYRTQVEELASSYAFLLDHRTSTIQQTGAQVLGAQGDPDSKGDM